MSLYRLPLLPLMVAALAGPWSAEAAPTLPGVRSAMEAMIAAKEITGAVTLVGALDHVLHLEATGLADIESGRAMREDTVFWIASMTKPITATAILMLQGEGRLGWVEPVPGVAYVLRVQRTDFGNSDASEVRRVFQEAAVVALAAIGVANGR